MDRRNAIKTLTALGLSTVIPFRSLLLKNYEPPIHYVGLGLSGSKVVEQLYLRGAKGKFTFITKDKNSEQQHIKGVLGKISFFANPELPNMPKAINFAPFNTAKHSGIDNEFVIPNNIKSLFNDDSKVVLITGLGKYSGTNLIINLMQMLKNRGVDITTAITTPFRFEGKNRMLIANEALNLLVNNTKCIYIKSEQVRERYSDLLVCDAFDKKRDMLIERILDRV